MTHMNKYTKHKQTHRHRQQSCGCPGEGDRGGMDWEFGISRCKLVYLEWINNNVLMYNTGNSIQYHVIKHIEKNMKKEYIYTHIHIYKIESLCCRVEINTTLKINYTSIKYFFNFLKT